MFLAFLIVESVRRSRFASALRILVSGERGKGELGGLFVCICELYSSSNVFTELFLRIKSTYGNMIEEKHSADV